MLFILREYNTDYVRLVTTRVHDRKFRLAAKVLANLIRNLDPDSNHNLKFN